MIESLARNISRYRKERQLTQEALAQRLGVTYQAVSKWENTQTMPDAALLPQLAAELGISLDKLFGYQSQEQPTTIYEEAYRSDQYYWGTAPSKTCYRVLELMPPISRLRLLDIGCGEGKDAVFFARNGYDVTAIDIAEAGIEKTKRLAAGCGAKVRAIRADLLDYRLQDGYDILYASGVLHYMPASMRNERFVHYKEQTNPGGIHVFNVFVTKPFIAPPPEHEPNACEWRSGELLSHYHDWRILACEEVIFDCHSSGIWHQHAMSIVIAQKPQEEDNV